MDQIDQIRGEAGFLRCGVKNGFEPRVRLELFPAFQHHGHAGLAARAERDKHHTARPDALCQFRRHQVGIQLVEMDGGIADRHFCNPRQTRRPLSGKGPARDYSLPWVMWN